MSPIFHGVHLQVRGAETPEEELDLSGKQARTMLFLEAARTVDTTTGTPPSTRPQNIGHGPGLPPRGERSERRGLERVPRAI